MKYALALLLFGCHGTDIPERAPPPAPVVSADAAVPVDARVIEEVHDGTEVPQATNQPPEFAAWVQRGAATLWRGPRNVRMTLAEPRSWNFKRDPIAMNVVGGKATIFDGTREATFDFAITSPCMATATESFGKGGLAFHTMEFVVKNGELLVGEGVVGIRRGKTAFVCGDIGSAEDVTIVEENGQCTRWGEFTGEWPHGKRSCAWSQKAGHDMLTIGTGESAEQLVVDGDVFMSDSFVESIPRFPKAKSFDEAKAAVTAELTSEDPVAQAKAVGGIAGKTDTVASLIVTYGVKRALPRKRVSVTGTLESIGAQLVDGGTAYQFDIVDLRDPSGKVDILCRSATPAPPGIVPNNTVVATGMIAPTDGEPELKRCTITAAK